MKKIIPILFLAVNCQSGANFVMTSSVDKVTNDTSVYSTGNTLKTHAFGPSLSLNYKSSFFTPKPMAPTTAKPATQMNHRQ